ncbi:hypothetical protein T310_2349 [Rasamsonia emersonii CBS 393.64]|uniref:Biogenesis of lysosome-related organelles complex 1 subunit KXD1 n=1 Tax=Rasamsonia emersonii (strain ATCC 16479 / CBS 393.64 / IMI 116815) TaxID=1408163 RepID=A0A0F4YZE1_RASE3|nr:hypothetical protein T310_2349 [Rasamsonia emersonii CBS 393.64]KKA23632.1 hypothetical protein T310_2349 [Rasamsonia emersonii CBS 393.64]
MATQRQYYQPAVALPINVPSKAPAPANYYPVTRVAVSPPELSDSSTTAGSRTSGFSGTSSSYAGSVGGDYESSSASGVDVVDMLNDRMNDAFDPTPLDRGLAMQAQASGQLNAKQRELLELQALAQRRLKGVRANFAEGLKAAKETKRDLEWTQKRVSNGPDGCLVTLFPPPPPLSVPTGIRDSCPWAASLPLSPPSSPSSFPRDLAAPLSHDSHPYHTSSLQSSHSRTNTPACLREGVITRYLSANGACHAALRVVTLPDSVIRRVLPQVGIQGHD